MRFRDAMGPVALAGDKAFDRGGVGAGMDGEPYDRV